MSFEDKTQRYKEMQIRTVSQEKLILMLYDGSVKFLNTALEGLKDKRFDVVNDNLVRVQRIFTELMVSLNMDVGEIAEHLFSLYQFMYDKLVDANVNKISKPIEEVIDMLISLREVWVRAIEDRKTKASPPGETKTTEDPTKPSGFDFVG